MYQYVLFDLDGTLVSSDEGIGYSLNHALTLMGEPPLTSEEVHLFIGPALDAMLYKLYGYKGEVLQRVMDCYAESYRTEGMYKTTVLPGMPELVAKLKHSGCRLAIATGKPWAYCEPILRQCGLAGLFDVIVGSYHNGLTEDKQTIIAEALRQLGVSPGELDRAIMVGDREVDVKGAAACGIGCVGVELCGYAEPNELQNAGAIAVAQSVTELASLLMQ